MHQRKEGRGGQLNIQKQRETQRIKLNKSQSFKHNKSWSFDIEEMDDSGYQALQLLEDNFLIKIKVIKGHLQNTTHPIAKFVHIFNEEFSKYYFKFLERKFNNESKCCVK